ncbi:17027_t:CDS:2 [Funneliformis caledonium]|uniref:17027_t:CDS:1 n=1 Tax=Funneliformis caledonium TaxID=1117310 RepID=A0A9N9FM92_9GLOM|nr:17027_t:CDS:2 [Funneliformis caledonium]
MSTSSATTDSKFNDEKKNTASNPPKVLNSIMIKMSHPETIESLHRMGYDFRWSASMDDPNRAMVFFFLADEKSALEFDDETGFILIFFYDNIDKGSFDGHKDKWVLVYKQQVKKYGSEYMNKELMNLDEEMPRAIYLPVDKLHRDDLVKSPSARTLRIRVRQSGTTNYAILKCNFNDPAEGNKLYKTVMDSGASEMILVHRALGKQGFHSIGDNNGWNKWVGIDNLRVLQAKPENQVDCSLIGTDVLGQFFFIHLPNQGFKFLDETDETRLTNFVNSLP